MKKVLPVATLVGGAILTLFVANVNAQSTSYWSSCSDGASIVRCETYNCPKGDTNSDGVCDLKDTSAEITESRNDSFCGNPPSGCGQVLYFATNQSASCAVRVKENDNSCNLYKASSPTFPTSTPTATTTPAPVSKLNTSPKPTVKPVSGNQTLPKTGAELWVSIFVAAVGMYGLYLYEKPRKRED